MPVVVAHLDCHAYKIGNDSAWESCAILEKLRASWRACIGYTHPKLFPINSGEWIFASLYNWLLMMTYLTTLSYNRRAKTLSLGGTSVLMYLMMGVIQFPSGAPIWQTKSCPPKGLAYLVHTISFTSIVNRLLNGNVSLVIAMLSMFVIPSEVVSRASASAYVFSARGICSCRPARTFVKDFWWLADIWSSSRP